MQFSRNEGSGAGTTWVIVSTFVRGSTTVTLADQVTDTTGGSDMMQGRQGPCLHLHGSQRAQLHGDLGSRRQ